MNRIVVNKPHSVQLFQFDAAATNRFECVSLYVAKSQLDIF